MNAAYSKLLIVFASLGLNMHFCQAEKPLVHYIFSSQNWSTDHISNVAGSSYKGLFAGSVERDKKDDVDCAVFSGNGAFIEIEDSESISIGKEGLTIVMKVWLDEPPPEMQMFVFKDSEFLFGARDCNGRNVLYSNVFTDADWIDPTVVLGGDPPTGRWTTLGVIFRPAEDGETLSLHYYIDGLEVFKQRFPKISQISGGNLIYIGKAWTPAWAFKGSIAEFKIYSKALPWIE